MKKKKKKLVLNFNMLSTSYDFMHLSFVKYSGSIIYFNISKWVDQNKRKLITIMVMKESRVFMLFNGIL